MNYLGLGSYHNEIDGDSRENRGLILNIVIMGVSMIVIAMVTIAVVANIDGPQEAAGKVKTLLSVCTKTEDPERCYRYLKHVGERAMVSDYVKAAINVTLRELFVVNGPRPQLERSLPLLQRLSYRDCLGLLNMAKEELEFLYKMAGSDVETDPDEVINSLSAVISYQHTCSNELMRTNSYQVLGYSLETPIILTRIILAIVSNFSERPPNPINYAKHQKGYPTWLSVTQRKMIKSQGYGDQQQPINAVVAQDGSGNFSTIAQSLNACPRNNMSPCVIYVKKGIYEGRVAVPKDVNRVVMFGDGPENTIVRGINHTGDPGTVTTSFRSATFEVRGNSFICKDMGFTAPAGIQGAPALLVLSDHAAFFNCKIDGEESSLYAVAHRQFYRDCEILGSVDIIKGDSATVIQNSQITVKAPNSSDLVLRRNVVSAQSRLDKYQRTGFVFQNCTITANKKSTSSLNATAYLGSPYSEYSRTVIMESFLGDVIHPRGWCEWSDTYGIETATFLEYDNRGPASRTDTRVKWYGYHTIFQRGQMQNYTAAEFIQARNWLQSARIPYESGFVFQK